jgi:two-component system response regulator LytT
MAAQTNVLVVEDESIVSKDIQHSLKKLGYNVVGAASTGEQAVAAWPWSTMPDIILMDIMLKGEMNGIEAADTIRKETNIPVIFLTAYADESTLNQGQGDTALRLHHQAVQGDRHPHVDRNGPVQAQEGGRGAQGARPALQLVENKEPAKDMLFVKSNSRLVKLQDQRHLLHRSAEGLCGDQHAEHPLHRPQHHEGHRGETAREPTSSGCTAASSCASTRSWPSSSPT